MAKARSGEVLVSYFLTDRYNWIEDEDKSKQTSVATIANFAPDLLLENNELTNIFSSIVAKRLYKQSHRKTNQVVM